MIHSVLRPAAAALALALGAFASAHSATGLTVDNFVDVGDSLSDMLDTSGLAFSTMLMGSLYAYRLFRAANTGVTPDSASQSKPYRSTR